MLEQVYIQGNVKYLKKIYETYKEIQDETELIKIAGRIVNKIVDKIETAMYDIQDDYCEEKGLEWEDEL